MLGLQLFEQDVAEFDGVRFGLEGDGSSGDAEGIGREQGFGVGVARVEDEALVTVDVFAVDAMDDLAAVDFELGGDPRIASDGWAVDFNDVLLDGFPIFEDVGAG